MPRGSSVDDNDGDVAGAPIDLLLTDAARGPWRRLMPSMSTLRFGVGLARRPSAVAGPGGTLLAELARVVAGTSDLAPGTSDRRFADAAWTGNPALRRLLQAYLVTAQTATRLVDDASLRPADHERVRAAVSNLADAAAPSNNPLVNPQVLKAVVDTGGASLRRGMRRFVRDMSAPPRVPTMVEPDAFEVGTTVAATAGTVVVRTPVLELIQYTPQTKRVRAIPLVIVPPTINKYYVVDMAPGRSLIEYLVRDGHQVFTISWRNPDAATPSGDSTPTARPSRKPQTPPGASPHHPGRPCSGCAPAAR